jgi:hypothetical protein
VHQCRAAAYTYTPYLLFHSLSSLTPYDVQQHSKHTRIQETERIDTRAGHPQLPGDGRGNLHKRLPVCTPRAELT